jgi:hypothetical protein
MFLLPTYHRGRLPFYVKIVTAVRFLSTEWHWSNMTRPELRKILNIIADKAENSTGNSVVDLVIIRESELPESEARKYVKELEELRMITMEHTRKSIKI